MSKKKILITGGSGMLAFDFNRSQSELFDIICVSRNECDITSFESILQSISIYEPDIVLNCAAYTAVDDAEDI
jgi:dTDP-4-dehydrorhamnose reductase